MLIAGCVPSYRLLLPLSSTCRHFYELIHEESVSGVLQTGCGTRGSSVRVSCWRRHPRILVAISRSYVQVDELRYTLEERDASFVPHMLTSLRLVPVLELVYLWLGGPHAAVLLPLRHFTRLRSLSLLLGQEVSARQQSLTTNVSTALLSLPSLVSLSFAYFSDQLSGASMLESSTLQRLARDQLLHILLDSSLYELLTTHNHSDKHRRRRQ